MNKICIGQLNNHRGAQAFCDYLKTKNINAWTEQNDLIYQIMIDDLESEDFAAAELREFLSAPSDKKYLDASWNEGTTDTSVKTTYNKDQSTGNHFKNFLSRAGLLTKSLVFISVAVTIFTNFGENIALTQHLFISVPTVNSNGLIEIMNGELWRLVTPIFLHFMIIHILFNMMWLWDLGGTVERNESPKFLLFFVLSTGIFSNLIQYYSTGHAAFGGMSGVVYGLLGYTWIKSSKLGSNYHLPKSVIMLMIGWLVLGYTGLLGPIANEVHLSGLMLGIVFGFTWNNMNDNNWQGLSVSELLEHYQDWQIVDIRDQASFQRGHVEGAFNLNNTNFQSYIDSHDLDKPIVVLCYHGNSSKGAAAVMANVGFKTVYSLDGGMTAWAMQHPDLTKGS